MDFREEQCWRESSSAPTLPRIRVFQTDRAEKVEKCMYCLIAAVGIAFLYLGDSWDIQTKRLYLFAMNGLIGAKVLTGLSVLYYRMIEKYRGDSDGV